MPLNSLLGRLFLLPMDCMRLHNGIADPLRKGGSTELRARVVILEWDEQPLSALRSSEWS